MSPILTGTNIPIPYYLLTPDGFTLSCEPKAYTSSLEEAKKDYEAWLINQGITEQGYYFTVSRERILISDLWDRMIIHHMPFYNVFSD